MPLVLKDRVKQLTTTTGTGAVNLSGSVAGFQSFSVIGNSNTTYYCITDGIDWEVGIGTYTSSGATLSRDTILESSNSNAAVNWGVGSKEVFVTYPAERSVYVENSSIVPASSATLPVSYAQNSQSANYTLVLSDAGKQIFHPSSDAVVRVFTIPANSSVAFNVGTVVLFTAENGSGPIEVTITSDTLVYGNNTVGDIFVAPGNTLMAIKVTSTKWLAYLLYQSSPRPTFYLAAHQPQSSPYVSIYSFDSNGFGGRYTWTNATFSTASSTGGTAFSSTGDAVVIYEAAGTNSALAYRWSDGGFGIQLTTSITLSGTGNIAFSPDNTALAFAHSFGNSVTVYRWADETGLRTTFTSPATLPTGNANDVAFSPDGAALAVAHATSPFVSVYPWSSSGFGTKFSNPATLPAGTGNAVAFHPASDAIAIAHDTTPFISVYPWSSSGFGTKFANPATLPASAGLGVHFSPIGDAIAVAHQTSPFVTAYPWSSSGFGTKFSDPATLPPAGAWDVAFSPNGEAIAVGHTTTPFISAYPWSSSGFGTKFSNPLTLPSNVVRRVSWGLP